MSTIRLTQRDLQTLRVLSWTQAPAALLLKASGSFVLPDTEEPYRDERRVRERMQILEVAGAVRSSQLTMPTGGVTKWYRLTGTGFRACHDDHEPLPPKTFFEPIKLTRQEHTIRLAEMIVHTIVASAAGRIVIERTFRENALKLEAGTRPQYPDFTCQFMRSGRRFNVMFELDNGTETLDSSESNSIREKILGYESHQDIALSAFVRAGSPRHVSPRFRVVFLTRSADRAQNIVALAGRLTQNRDRRLCLAATLDDYLAAFDALREPIFLDHHGRWQSLVNTAPTSQSRRTPVRLQTS